MDKSSSSSTAAAAEEEEEDLEERPVFRRAQTMKSAGSYNRKNAPRSIKFNRSITMSNNRHSCRISVGENRGDFPDSNSSDDDRGRSRVEFVLSGSKDQDQKSPDLSASSSSTDGTQSSESESKKIKFERGKSYLDQAPDPTVPHNPKTFIRGKTVGARIRQLPPTSSDSDSSSSASGGRPLQRAKTIMECHQHEITSWLERDEEGNDNDDDDDEPEFEIREEELSGIDESTSENRSSAPDKEEFMMTENERFNDVSCNHRRKTEAGAATSKDGTCEIPYDGQENDDVGGSEEDSEEVRDEDDEEEEIGQDICEAVCGKAQNDKQQNVYVSPPTPSPTPTVTQMSEGPLRKRRLKLIMFECSQETNVNLQSSLDNLRDLLTNARVEEQYACLLLRTLDLTIKGQIDRLTSELPATRPKLVDGQCGWCEKRRRRVMRLRDLRCVQSEILSDERKDKMVSSGAMENHLAASFRFCAGLAGNFLQCQRPSRVSSGALDLAWLLVMHVKRYGCLKHGTTSCFEEVVSQRQPLIVIGIDEPNVTTKCLVRMALKAMH